MKDLDREEGQGKGRERTEEEREGARRREQGQLNGLPGWGTAGLETVASAGFSIWRSIQERSA